MFQIDQPTAAATLPTPAAAGTPGYFTNGNPATGNPATIVDADFLNMLMMELSNTVTGAGIALSKTAYNQVLSAIKRIGQNTTILADTGAANAYTATNSPPLVAGTWVDGVVQAVKIAHANTGASTYAPDGLPTIPVYGLGLQALQGGELVLGGTAILMRSTIAGVNSGNPICVLMECAGGAQQVPGATQSQHAMQLGQATGRLLRTTVYTLNSGVQQVSVNGGAFTSTGAGTFTALAATTSIVAEVIGGGGGSGSTSTTGSSNISVVGGGGGGGYQKGLFTSGFASLAVTVGAGGSAGTTGGNGGSGGTSSLGALCSASGGSGSIGNINASSGTTFLATGAGGGNGAGGNLINAQGSAGTHGFSSGVSLLGGSGGASGLGGGGYGTGGGYSANPGVSPGSGAGGPCVLVNSTTIPGAIGAPGRIIVQEFA